MHIGRIFTLCPYLSGSLEGIVCNAALTLVRNIGDIDPDMCITRHFELCHLYISKLGEMNVFSPFAGTGCGQIPLTEM
jgi:hypothetical protein